MKKFETIALATAHITEQDAIIAVNNATIKSLEKALNDALAEVGTLSAKLDLQEKHGGEGSTIVTIAKKAYKLIGNRFITKDGEKNAEEASKDSDFLAHLLKISSGALTPLD